MSVTTRTNVFSSQSNNLEVVLVKSFSLVGLGALTGSLWIVKTVNDDWYFGRTPTSMQQVVQVNSYGDDRISDVTAFITKGGDDLSPLLMLVAAHHVTTPGQGGTVYAPPYLAMYMITSVDQFASSMYAYTICTIAYYDRQSMPRQEIVFSTYTSAPYTHQKLTLIGEAGPSHPEALFLFGMEAGAFIYEVDDLMHKKYGVTALRVPTWDRALEPWYDTNDGPATGYQKPWRIEAPCGYISKDYTEYETSAPPRYTSMGLAAWGGITRVKPLTMFSWSRQNSLNVKGNLHTLQLVTRPSGALEVQLHNQGPHEPFMCLEGGVGGGIRYEYALPTHLQVEIGTYYGAFILGWDVLQEATAAAGAAANGDGVIYGLPSVVVHGKKWFRVYQGVSNNLINMPLAGNLLSLDTGYYGLLMDASTGKGTSSVHLTNAGMVLAVDNLLLYSANPNTFDWNNPDYEGADFVSSNVGDKNGALVNFRGTNTYGGSLTPGWWAMQHYANSTNGVTLNILHSYNGFDWTVKHSEDVLAGAISSMNDTDHVWYNTFNVRKYSTLGMMYFRVEMNVTPTGGGAIKTIAYTVYNSMAQATDEFVAELDENLGVDMCIMPSVMLGDAQQDVFLQGGDRAIYKVSSTDGSLTTAMLTQPAYSLQEKNKSWPGKHYDLTNTEVSAVALLECGGTIYTVGFYDTVETPVAFLVTLGTPTLFPVVDAATRWYVERGTPTNYSTYKARHAVSHKSFGSIIFLSDMLGQDLLGVGVGDTGGLVHGSTHVMFSETGLMNSFDNGDGAVVDVDREPFTFLPLGYVVQGVYEHYSAEPSVGTAPVIYLTDELGNIRTLQFSESSSYSIAGAEFGDVTVSALVTFDTPYDPVEGFPMLVKHPSLLPLMPYNGIMEAQGSESFSLVPSAYGQGKNAVAVDGTRCLSWYGANGNLFHGGQNTWIIDICATVSAVPDGSWGCLFHVSTGSPGMIDLLLNPSMLQLRWRGAHAEMMGNADVMYVWKNYVDGLPHHYRVIFAGNDVYLVIDGVLKGHVSHDLPSWFESTTPSYPETYVTLMADSHNWGYFCTGSIEWFRVLNANCLVGTGLLEDELVTKFVPTGKPGIAGDYHGVKAVSTPVTNTSLANSGKYHLTLAHSGDMWVAAWCEAGGPHQPMGPLCLATSSDMTIWTRVEGSEVVTEPASPIYSMKGIKPQIKLPTNAPAGSRGWLDNFYGSF